MASISPVPGSKPSWVLEYQPKPDTWLGRNVKWLKKDEGQPTNALKKFIFVLEAIGAVLSIVGIYFLVKGKEMADRIDVENRFAQEVKGKSAPSPDLEITEKTATETFNHVQEFVIKEGVIWERAIGTKEWKPLYFDGYSEKRLPTEIHADGANLVVLDQERAVHYKKILHEYRKSELEDLKNPQADYGRKMVALLGQEHEIHTHPYIVFDKASKNNWKERWFSLPVLGELASFFQGNRIHVPKDALAWGISHRGRYNDHYEDRLGRPHRVKEGVTTLYVLCADGKTIWKYDPWANPKADVSVTVIDTPDSTYQALNMSPSSSTVMLIGYESTSNPQGGTTKTLKIKTRLTDIDVEGVNPTLKYTYTDPKTAKHRVMGFEEWQEHDLPPGRVTKSITILQTGEGNNSRQLRVKGEDKNGQKGEFFKNLDDKVWQFKPFSPEKQTAPLELLDPIQQDETPFHSEVADYNSSSLRLPPEMAKPEKVALLGFGKHSTDSLLQFQYKDRGFNIYLHKKRTFKNFLGIKGHSYDLVVPKELVGNPDIQALFPGKDKRVQSVHVKLSASKVILQGANFTIKFRK